MALEVPASGREIPPEPPAAAGARPGAEGTHAAAADGSAADRRLPDPATAVSPAPGALEAGALEAVALQRADLEACVRLDGLALGGFWTAHQWETELTQPRRPCCGLRRQGELVALACGWLVVDELHITLVAVHPDLRRRGLGRLVLSDLLQRAEGEGTRHATLEVAAANAAAQALYSRCGFRTAGVRRRYYRDGDDALIQWLKLSSITITPSPPA